MGRGRTKGRLTLVALISLAGLNGGAVSLSGQGPLQPGVCQAWRVVPALNLRDSELDGVSGTSPTDIWAVGNYGEKAPPYTLHWDGTAWTKLPAARAKGLFYKVAAITPTDAWAVGYGYALNGKIKALVEHWDGSKWGLINVPSPQNYDYLYDVASLSSTDVWAVGSYTGSNGVIHPLSEHWDGTAWNLVQAPDATPFATVLHSLAVVSSNDIWAVGYEQTAPGVPSPIQPLAEHWDGATWSVVDIPPPTGTVNYLNKASGASSSDIWAVGSFGTNGSLQSLTEHWDGTAWTQVSAPQAPANINTLTGVTAISTGDVWAVGSFLDNGPASPLTLHWDGGSWQLVTAPDPGNGVFLDSWAYSSTDIWAVGAFNSPIQPLTEQSKGPCPA